LRASPKSAIEKLEIELEAAIAEKSVFKGKFQTADSNHDSNHGSRLLTTLLPLILLRSLSPLSIFKTGFAIGD